MITLHLRANLKRYAGGKEIVSLEPGEKTVLELTGALGIPESDIMVFLVDGKRIPRDHVPRDGEEIEILPSISGGASHKN